MYHGSRTEHRRVLDGIGRRTRRRAERVPIRRDPGWVDLLRDGPRVMTAIGTQAGKGNLEPPRPRGQFPSSELHTYRAPLDFAGNLR
jgi:hypothetical protein